MPPVRGPHAVFARVPVVAEPLVARHVAASVAAYLGAPAPEQRRLIALVGEPGFYDVVAQLDPASAKDWREMGKVQRAFHAAEPGFDDKTRAYSESMRLTLHAALIQHLGEPHLFETFLELHPTAFDENGAWFDNMQIGWRGALDVVRATPFEMVYHLEELVEGGFERDEATVRAAQWVRDARLAVIGPTTATTTTTTATTAAPSAAASSGPPRRGP